MYLRVCVQVVRPDSGDPATIVVQVLEALGSKFEPATTSTGHKILPDYIRVIQVRGWRRCVRETVDRRQLSDRWVVGD
jgi:nicotinic acid phosphoribosyltransferase